MQAEVRNDLLFIDGKQVEFKPSPNTSGARIEPALIVLHDTADWTKYSDDAVSWFSNPRSKVSAHLVIDRKGKVTQCLPFDKVAWHSAPSSWGGRPGSCNGYAIGIEFDNPGGLVGSIEKAKASFGEVFTSGIVAASSTAHWSKFWLPYTDAQLAVGEAIVRALGQAYSGILEVVGHHDVSPGRKEDPTPLMPWDRMRAALGPRARPIDRELVVEAQQALAGLGYGPGPADGIIGARTRGALRTFQEQNKLPITGVLDEATFMALRVGLEANTAKAFPLGNRAEMTTVPGSRTSTAVRVVKAGTAIGVGVELGSALIDAGSALTEVTDAVATVEKGISLVDRVGQLLPKLETLWAWLQTPPGLKAIAALIVLAAVWKLGSWVMAWRLADARSGANASK